MHEIHFTYMNTFLCGAKNWTQGLVCSRKAPCHWTTSLTLLHLCSEDHLNLRSSCFSYQNQVICEWVNSKQLLSQSVWRGGFSSEFPFSSFPLQLWLESLDLAAIILLSFSPASVPSPLHDPSNLQFIAKENQVSQFIIARFFFFPAPVLASWDYSS